jgi:hypothetical protein
MGETRKHPDLFSPDEAAEYLHLEGKESLKNLREKGLLVGYSGFARHLIYHREDLDRCALRMCGRNPDAGKPNKMELKIAGGNR